MLVQGHCACDAFLHPIVCAVEKSEGSPSNVLLEKGAVTHSTVAVARPGSQTCTSVLQLFQRSQRDQQ
eukprot:6403617-Amphidinium_carterae.3